jgi:hypothetical protein
MGFKRFFVVLAAGVFLGAGGVGRPVDLGGATNR